MYWKFGVQGIGTTFRPIGLIKADNKETAIIKMNDWAKEQTNEYLNSFLCLMKDIVMIYVQMLF